jgi:hypothetical protein
MRVEKRLAHIKGGQLTSATRWLGRGVGLNQTEIGTAPPRFPREFEARTPQNNHNLR